jgi:hypothetical protein
MCDEETVRRLALALPGAEEGLSYGTTAYRVGGKLFARMLDSDAEVVVKTTVQDREALVGSAADVYVVTPHYRNYPMVVVRLDGIAEDELAETLTAAWRCAAPRRLLSALGD